MKILWMSLALLVFPATGMSEMLLIDAVKAEQKSSIPRPKNGDSMAEVEHRFGPPKAKRGPVGDPPITRWDYEDFSVYFEYEKVLTAVLNRDKLASVSAEKH